MKKVFDHLKSTITLTLEVTVRDYPEDCVNFQSGVK